ncbi:TPR domain/sulfotransferase domain protein [Candidatus Rhodobacter oscarellae]|uniref:TPR domain/sulfotransferase domain protein n=1 Tax=Candidatus Rhodobacter oscarellae TaxID=1675527 RepID=A0A0J9E3Z6_9RHOB|nr:sulfotransferase family protein [Candidatus Rhodobacter lobularis]KMW57437.1 TPR domain/sulfotransferase domain protein [Candidatus Rhodobacter lobularis]
MPARDEIHTAYTRGDIRRAVAMASDYCEDHPKDFEILALIGAGLTRMRHLDLAERLFLQLCEAAPTAAHLRGLGLVHSSRGDMMTARKLLQEAIAQEPHDVLSLAAFAEIHRFRRGEKLLGHIEGLLAETWQEPDWLSQVHYVMCKAMQDTGQWRRAWQHAEHGAKLAQAAPYQPALMDSWRAGLLDLAALGAAAPRDHNGPQGENQIFVVGMPRSGTTLLEALLSNATGVASCGEVSLISDRAKAGFARRDAMGELSHRWLLGASSDDLAAWASEYVSEVQTAANARRYVDKFPGNILCLPHIGALFPKARILHIRRDPLDTCVSCFTGRFFNGNSFALDIGHLAHAFALYEGCAADVQAALPNPYHEVSYERLVTTPREEMQKVMAFLDLPWEDAVMHPEAARNAVVTRSRGQVRQKIHRRSVQRWKRYSTAVAPLAQALAAQGVNIGEGQVLLREDTARMN